MQGNIVMRSRDAIAGKAAQCFATVGNRRYNFMMLLDFEATIEKQKAAIPRLGAMMVGHKTFGMEGKFKGTAHYNQSVTRQMLEEYKATGEDIYFEIQVTNYDPTSAAGRQTAILYDCNLDGGVLAKFDTGAEWLEEEVSGTFEDFSLPEGFTDLAGFLTN